MNVDFTPIVQGLLALASAAVTVAIPILVPAVLKRWHIASDTDLAAKLDVACNAAAGMAYNVALEHEGGLANVGIKNLALAAAASSVVNNFQSTMTRFGLTPEHVQDMVQNRLGKLLAADPTVSAGQPAPAPLADTPKPPAPVPAIIPPPPAPGPGTAAAVLSMFLLVSVLGLAGCGSLSLPTAANVKAATTATISQAQFDLQTSINLYDVAKGIGQVAGLVNPPVGAVVATIASFTDPVVAKAQLALNDATVDATAIEALAAQIAAQANAITVQAAPSVKVIPNVALPGAGPFVGPLPAPGS